MSPLKFITREQWGAVPPKKTVPMTHPILYVGFSYVEVRDVFDKEIVKKVQKLHMEVKEYSDIECSFVIGRDGSVYEGRGWFTQPEMRDVDAEGGNYLEIGFIGQVKGKREDNPSLVAMIELLQFGIDNKYLDEDYAMFGNTDEDIDVAEARLQGMGDSKESDVTYHPINDTYQHRGYVTRVEWGARPPIRIRKLNHPIPFVCLSYNDTTHPHSKQFIKETQKAHIQRGMWDIQSNFIVATDGTLYEGRGWEVQPSKMFDKYEKYNGKFFDITILGKLPGPAKEDDPYFKEILALITFGLQSNKIALNFEFIHDKEGLMFLDPAQRHSLPPKSSTE